MALAREQQLSALGGVVAAAAHELGTPLATIKLAATELVEELADRPHLQEDAALVRAQADRCTEILRGMGPRGKEDVAGAPRAASRAWSRRRRRRMPTAASASSPASKAPSLEDGPEVQPPWRAGRRSSRACATWCRTPSTSPARRSGSTSTGRDAELRVVIGDDGPGYPPDLIGRIGDPFVRRRPVLPKERPGYEGMGLGLFIAKTLLERSGARPSLRQRRGAGGGRGAGPGRVRPPDRRGRHRGLAARAGRRRAGASRAPLGANARVPG